MVSRVLWVSKRLMLPIEFAALQKIFGENVSVHQESTLAARSGKSIAHAYKTGNYQDLVVYGLKVSVLAQIQELNIQPLIPQMLRVEYHTARLSPDSCIYFESGGEGFGYRFSHFERAVGSMILFEDLK